MDGFGNKVAKEIGPGLLGLFQVVFVRIVEETEAKREIFAAELGG